MIMDQHSQSTVINFCIWNIVSLPLFLRDTLSLPASSLIILAPPFPGPTVFLWLTYEDTAFCFVLLSLTLISSSSSPEDRGTMFKMSVNL
jgi:hypothetical protein